MAKDYTTTVRERFGRMTPVRRKLASMFDDATASYTAREVYERCTEIGVDLVTVYRNLERFVELDLLMPMDIGKGGVRYQRPSALHRHRITCRQCHTVMEMDHCMLGQVDTRVASATGFAGVAHIATFTGICPACH